MPKKVRRVSKEEGKEDEKKKHSPEGHNSLLILDFEVMKREVEAKSSRGIKTWILPKQQHMLCHVLRLPVSTSARSALSLCLFLFLMCAHGPQNRTDPKKNLQGSSTATQQRAWTEGCMILRPRTMSAFICIWACFLLRISATATAATHDKTPDETVTCLVSEECHLPCMFTPAPNQSVRWFRRDVVMFSFGETHGESQVLAGRATMFPPMIAGGNATLVLREVGLKDRGMYRCHVRTSEGEHSAKVVLKVEALIHGLSLELSRLSGYEEMKCIVRDVFPPPRVTWATEPPTFEDLRPITRMLADKRGLYTADSRLKVLKGQPDLIYICKVTTSYGGPTWTSSLRERTITGNEGRDLTIPCFAPPYLNSPILHWSFSKGEDPAHILTYDSRSGHSTATPAWEHHVELDGFRVPFGDGSLRLMDPEHTRHQGTYSCIFSMPYNTHTERSDVAINLPTANRSTSPQTSYWWIVGLVVAVTVLALTAMLVYLRLRGNAAKSSSRYPEEETELNSVRDVEGEGENIRRPAGDNNGQPGLS